MNKLYIQIRDDQDINLIPEYLSKYSGKILLISLIQENRKLEEVLGLVDYIIYDNQDYISGIIDLEDALIQADERIDLLPSSYKIKTDNADLSKIKEDVDKLDYDQAIFLFDKENNYPIENMEDLETIGKKGFLHKIKDLFKK